MPRQDEIRLMARVARMYYGHGIRQQEITEKLHLPQSTISRLLKRAREEKIVRICVSVPSGIFPELEEGLESKYGLSEAIVVDCLPDGQQMVKDLGNAAAYYLESTIKEGDNIGVCVWSRYMRAMVDSLNPSRRGRGGKVIEIVGGMGDATARTRLSNSVTVQRLASLIGATEVLLPVPSIVGSPEAKRVLENDPSVRQATDMFKQIDIALVGIGSIQPSTLVAGSGNSFSPDELNRLQAKGAVGDICMRFFNEQGRQIPTLLHDRVIGIEPETLKSIRRIVGVSGGSEKFAAIHGALRGGWINTLITDKGTAEKLLI